MSDKPSFDPTKPFTVSDSGQGAKPKFDPSQPFQSKEQEPPIDMGSELWNSAKEGGSALLKGLGYAGGVTRTALAKGIDALSGTTLTNDGDFYKALSGEAPTSAQMLTNAGVPAGDSLSDAYPFNYLYSDTGKGLALKKGGAADPTIRGLGGLVLDTATDPLTYASMGAGALARSAEAAQAARAAEGVAPTLGQRLGEFGANALDTVANPVSNTLEGAGAKVYSSGLKNIDSRLVEKGQEPVSPYLLDLGAWGTKKSLKKAMDARSAEIAAERQGIYNQMADKGVTIDPQAASQEAYQLAQDVAKDPYMKPKVDPLLDYLNLGQDRMSPELASSVKTNLYNSLPAAAFDENGRLTNLGQKINKALSLGYKKELEAGAEFAQPGMGQDLTDLNKEWGAYLGADKPTRAEIAKDARPNFITQVKAALFHLDPTVAAAMYGAQGLNSAPVRTGAGLLMNRTGQYVPEGVWRQMLLEAQQQNQQDSQ